MLTTQWLSRLRLSSLASQGASRVSGSFRPVSTLGAIKKGIRASRDSRKPRHTSKHRILRATEKSRPAFRSEDIPRNASRGTFDGSSRSPSFSQRTSRTPPSNSYRGGSERRPGVKKAVDVGVSGGGFTKSRDRGPSYGQRSTSKFVDRKNLAGGFGRSEHREKIKSDRRTSISKYRNDEGTEDSRPRQVERNSGSTKLFHLNSSEDAATMGTNRAARYGQRQTSKSADRDKGPRKSVKGTDSNGFQHEKSLRRESNMNHQSHGRDQDDSALAHTESYSTAASQFLYGTNTVRAALMAKRRKLYKLHVMGSADDRGTSLERQKILELNKRGDHPVPVKYHSDVRVLDVMAGGRQHNGLVLDAAPIPVAPVEFLMEGDMRTVRMALQPQSTEEENVNQAATSVWETLEDRSPLVVLLDGILDEGNLGGILRSAFLLGVDAVAVCTSTCAPLNSAIVAKASSGACEGVRLLAVSRPASFAASSAKHGWKLWATGTSVKDKKIKKLKAHEVTGGQLSRPTILMIGGEGSGLPESLMNKAHELVYIETMPGPSTSKLGIDSFNVSVASALLMERILRP